VVIAPPLTCLSWNLAMLARSQEAPPWWTQEHTEAQVRQAVLDWSPDLVAFQELPGIVPFVETHDMVRANPRSHSGNLATLIGNHLIDELAGAPSGGADRDGGPASPVVVPGCGLLVAFPAFDLTVANVHLAPGRGGSAVRLAQLRSVLDLAGTGEILILGDTNTRTAEEGLIESMGLVAPRPPRPTWDGRRNPFNGPSGDFVAYFTRAIASPGVRILDQRVRPGRVTADGHGFHLSDHYALEVTVALG
jgi:endonuclease/exonuclease/phosphatase family metal-dependent hydrolase